MKEVVWSRLKLSQCSLALKSAQLQTLLKKGGENAEAARYEKEREKLDEKVRKF